MISPGAGPCGTWIEVCGSSFGSAQEEMSDGTGVRRVVDFVASSGTYTALKYRNWSDGHFEVRFFNFFEDLIDPNTDERNFVQDDGSGACPQEPSIRKCGNLQPGVYALYVKSIYFDDEDSSGALSCGDNISEVVSSDPVYFELTNEPAILRLKPTEIESGERLIIKGLNFGPTQGSGEVRIGNKNKAQSPTPGQGKLLSNTRLWSNTVIKVKLTVPLEWEGKRRCVWVEKGGMKSNYKRLNILAP
jgi:hypothetical protein